ncbi:MAG TPA: hypothetical protein VID70_11115 [Solirubrobacteraceae bacterium]
MSVRRAAQLAALVVAVLALTGCESNAQRSAKLEKAALAERLAHPQTISKGVIVTRNNPQVKITQTAVVHDENGVAAVVALRNESAKPLREAPIAITVSDAKGAVLYQNDAPGLDSTLVSAPILRPHTDTVWIDDQIQTAGGVPAKVSARVGEAPAASGASSSAPPVLRVSGVHTFEDPSNGVGVEGTVSNRSQVPQQKLVVYVVGRRGVRIVAAGRAVLAQVGAGQSTAFQVFCIGNPRGAALEASALASTFG